MALNYEPGPLTTIEVTWLGDPNTPAGSVVVRGPHGTGEDGKPITPAYVLAQEFKVELEKDGKPVLPVEVGILDEIRVAERLNASREIEVYHVAVITVACRISRDKVIGLTPENEAKLLTIVAGKRGRKIEFTGQYAGFDNPVIWLKTPEPKPVQAQAARPRPAARPTNQPANQPAPPTASGSAANASAGNGPAS